jgi:hypothetical protein
MKEKEMECGCDRNVTINKSNFNGGSGAIYGLSVIGALFYFLQHAVTFVAVILGIGKAFFWPAILMFKLLTYLQM